MVGSYTRQDAVEMRRHHADEGMNGISPRYVMNRIAAVASIPDVKCVTPLAVLDSLWQGMSENVSLDQAGKAAFIGLGKRYRQRVQRIGRHRRAASLRRVIRRDCGDPAGQLPQKRTGLLLG